MEELGPGLIDRPAQLEIMKPELCLGPYAQCASGTNQVGFQRDGGHTVID